MVGVLLWRGMLVGFIAGTICFAFLKLAGEPPVERAIAFEAQVERTKAQADAHAQGDAHTHPGAEGPREDANPELVSRAVQAGLGLFTGVAVYSAAFGGLFALAFALAYGRMGDFSPRATAALLAGAGFVAVYVVPILKYPPNPPSVGDAETIGMRTALYFSMIALSLAAIIGAGMVRLRLQPRFGAWNACLIAAAVYVVTMIVAGVTLPVVNEVPEQFPADVLWQFRIVSIGAQLLLWTTLGLGFGVAAERVALSRSALPAVVSAH
jgi:Probable cobalt transporter subunit (CbtA)